MTFLHLPSNRTVTAKTPSRLRAYRRSSNFLELPPIEHSEGVEYASDTLKPTSVVPATTVKGVLDWVDGDRARARAALEYERSGMRRKTLVAALEKLTDV